MLGAISQIILELRREEVMAALIEKGASLRALGLPVENVDLAIMRVDSDLRLGQDLGSGRDPVLGVERRRNCEIGPGRNRGEEPPQWGEMGVDL